MINENELQISNRSYTKKDFAQIYPELLDLAKALTSKWDPSQSNESDPGVVLLKLSAFLADKLNYNIDKNILEAFLPSATQMSSMRALCEMNGYTPGYYKSGETKISFMYLGSKDENDNEKLTSGNSIRLNKFDTVITDVDNSVKYTLVEDLVISPEDINKRKTAKAVQGTIKLFKINDSELIQLSNLDDNNRLYFPEIAVAENEDCIFINSVDPASLEINESEDVRFKQVKNLNTFEPGAYIYKFGFDSMKNLPYIEFPADIANLMGAGLVIHYTITDGYLGNIAAKKLTKLATVTSYTISDNNTIDLSDTLSITNYSAVINGYNPETINEAYNSFKKTVGTFDTLITCRDYRNAIYNLDINSAGDKQVSNIQVSDRRDDINYSKAVLTFDINGEHIISATDSNLITPFDLCLYPLKTINVEDIASYNRSFTPSDSTEVDDILNKIFNTSEYNSCISHTVKNLGDKDIYLLKNYYTLDIKIATKDKVTALEQDEIKEIIKQALIKNFNSRKLDYGYEIPYDSIVEIVQNADTRIKTVSIADPELTTYVLLKDGSEVKYIDINNPANSKYLDILALNILAGKASLFEFNNDFLYDYGHVPAVKVGNNYQSRFDNIKGLKTELAVTADALKNGYKLKKHEVIQLFSPNTTSERSFAIGAYYALDGFTIRPKANELFTLGENQSILFAWNDSSSTSDIKDHFIEYTSSEMNIDGIKTHLSSAPSFKANFDLQDSSQSGTKIKYKSGSEKPMIMLTSTQEIARQVKVERELSYETLSGKTLHCYWILNNKSEPLFDPNIKKRILAENEYFIWTDDTYSTLNILGSGTKLTLKCLQSYNNYAQWEKPKKIISLESINNAGLAAFSIYDWTDINFKSDNSDSLTLTEMEIYSFNEGDTVKAEIESISTLSNKPQKLVEDTEFQYELASENQFTTIPAKPAGFEWEVKSRLDIEASKTLAQELDVKDSSYQNIYVITTDPETSIDLKTSSSSIFSIYLNSSTYINKPGSDFIDLGVTEIDAKGDLKPAASYPISLYVYAKEDIVFGTSQNIPDAEGNYYFSINSFKSFTSELDLPLDLSLLGTLTSLYPASLISIYLSLENEDAKNLTFKIKQENGTDAIPYTNFKIYDYTVFDNQSPKVLTELKPGLNILLVVFEQESAGTPRFEIYPSSEIADTSNPLGSIIISRINIVEDLNKSFNLTIFGTNEDAAKTALLNKINTLQKKEDKNLFYYLNNNDESYMLNSDDISSPEALWDTNNIANKFTLAQLNLSGIRDELGRTLNTKIDIVRSSRK